MLLSVSGLSRRVGSKALFADLSFELDEGQTLAILGPSGSGKSSLLRCLACLDPTSGGELLLEGRAPREVGFPVWRSSLGYVAQQPPALRGSARDFAEQVAELEVQRGRVASSPFEIGAGWGLSQRLWDQPFSDLSGGERQRALLALAVARKPRILLLDEPTSALDAETTQRVERSLQGLSVVWVTHDIAQAERVATERLELSA